MSAVSILSPIMVASWPAFSRAVAKASASLGFEIVADKILALGSANSATALRSVELSIENSELVMNQLGRNQRIIVSRDGVSVYFFRDARGKASLCVTGRGQTLQSLRTIGEELSGRVVQQYVYQRLKEELHTRHFNIIEEEADANNSIHMKVRHWES